MTVDANTETVKCSFCGKSREEVTQLIAGPGVYICDHCIRLGYDIVSDEQELGSADRDGRAMPPFGRFSGRARAAVVEAQQAARELRHNSLGTEHLLLGLLVAADGPLAELFSSHGLQADGVRSSVTQLVGPSQGHVVAAPPFTPRALRSLVLAGEQASGLGHKGVDAAHLVLGLLSEGHGLAARLLQAAGIGLEDVQTIARSG